MGKQVIAEYKDPRLSQGPSPEHKLSALIGVDSLSFEISASNGESLCWKEYALSPSARDEDALAVFREDALLSNTRYLTAHIGLFHEPAALVPARLFNPDNAPAYRQTLGELHAHQKTLYDALPALEAFITYTAGKALVKGLLAAQPQGRIYHGATAWLNGLYRHILSDDTGGAVFAHVAAGKLAVAAFENRSLRFFNYFSCQTARDYLYYILLGLTQAQLPLEHTSLYLSGKMTAEAEIFLLLQRYFVSLHFLSPPSAGPYPAGMAENRRHWYFDLQCMRFL